MPRKSTLPMLCAAVLLGGSVAIAEHVLDANRVMEKPLPGETLDNGLGEPPPYRLGTDFTVQHPVGAPVAGEKPDSALGELLPYRRWTDPTGHSPLAHVQR